MQAIKIDSAIGPYLAIRAAELLVAARGPKVQGLEV